MPVEELDPPPASDPNDYPAGKVYLYRGRPSTHLNTVIGDDEEGYRLIPMLVPGQKDVEALLKGQRATQEQMGIALEAARKRLGNYPPFKSIDEALKYEQQWRRENIPRIEDAIRRMLEQQGRSLEPEGESVLTGKRP